MTPGAALLVTPGPLEGRCLQRLLKFGHFEPPRRKTERYSPIIPVPIANQRKTSITQQRGQRFYLRFARIALARDSSVAASSGRSVFRSRSA
jgi:hypothetical protein